jgi:hypothetical protein
MPKRLWGFIIVVVLVASACAPTPELRNDAYFHDTSLIDGEPCFAPCWRNLIPGETTWDVVEDTFETFEDVSNPARERNRDTGEEYYDFHYMEGPQCCRLYTRDGSVLASILLLVAPEMAVGAVLEQYGEPQYVQAQDITDDQTFVVLVFPQVPMLVYAYGAGIPNGAITAESEVIGTVYLSSAEMAVFLSETALFTWDGYGALSAILSGEAVIPASNAASSESN